MKQQFYDDKEKLIMLVSDMEVQLRPVHQYQTSPFFFFLSPEESVLH
jgi:hypothetical protein